MYKKKLQMLLSIVLIFASRFSGAELPPQTYTQLQSDAQFKAGILVTQTKTYPVRIDGLIRCLVEVTAVVTKVFEKDDPAKLGQSIQIRYSIAKQAIPTIGPKSNEVLQNHKHYIAFLNQTNTYFIPAARGESFVIDQQQGNL